MGVLVLAVTSFAHARTVYIRDTLYVPLRGGQSSEHRIIHRGMRSGTAMELLEQNEDSGYSLVRLEDGLEGWVQTQYLVDEPIARDLLDEARARALELETTSQKNLVLARQLEAERDETAAELDQVRQQLAETKAELDEISTLAADVINIDERNQQLIDERERYEREIDTLLQANNQLQDRAAQDWFMRGAAVIVIALLLGFWVGRRIYHRRYSGWA